MKQATVRFFISSVFGLALAHCTGSKEEKRSSTASEKQAATASEVPACPGPNCSENSVPAANLGLFPFCTYETQDQETGCFICSPYELPRKQCVKVSKEFDPKTKCTQDADKMTCQTGGDQPLELSFAERKPDEEIYESMPLLIMGGKALVLHKLSSKPDSLALVFKVLDSISTHRRELFTGGDVGPIVDESTPLLRKVKPTLTDVELLAIKTAVNVKAKEFAEKRAQGTMSLQDAFQALNGAYKALPSETFAGTDIKQQMDKFAAALAGKKDQEAIFNELSKALGGDLNLAATMAQLGGLLPPPEQPAAGAPLK